MSWAIVNIWKQSHYSGNISPKPNTFDAEKKNSAPVELDPSLVLPKQDKILYPIYPMEGDNIGSLTIPTLDSTMPIYQGTAEKELKKGIGHFSQSVLPGEKNNCVISGHRETAFRRIGELKIGDALIVKTSAGTFTYEVKGTRIVHKDDKTVIVPTDDAVLTMTTCYPFNFIGSAPDRYIISADLVKNK
jgi:sortase A